MPEIVHCPQCQRKLSVPDRLLGKKVKCPSCATMFTATAATSPVRENRPAAPPEEQREEEVPQARRKPAAPPPREEYEEEPPEAGRKRPHRRQAREKEDADEPDEQEEEERRPQRPDPGDWGKVRTGVTLVLISLCLLIVYGVVVFLAGMFLGLADGARQAAFQPGKPQGVPPPVVQQSRRMAVFETFSDIGRVIVGMVGILGYAYCLSVPLRGGTRNLIVATLALALVGLLVSVGDLVWEMAQTKMMKADGEQPQGPGISAVKMALTMVGVILWAAELLTFLFFLRAVNLHLRGYGAAKSVFFLIILFSVFFAVLLLMAIPAAFLLARAAGTVDLNLLAGSAFVFCGAVCILVLLGLPSLVWYIVALAQTRFVISDHLQRG